MIQKRLRENILHTDYDMVVSLIEPQSRVLDLGCGTGGLLQRLIEERQVQGMGVEIKQEAVIECIHKGLSVFQGDIDTGLADYVGVTYDYVILNQTLQAIHRPGFVIDEMLRVGKKAIISFPNFGFWRIRLQLLFNGTMPQTEKLPFFWYNTPNIHLLTIRDFVRFCHEHDIQILKKVCLRSGRKDGVKRIRLFSNIFADEGIFIITRKGS